MEYIVDNWYIIVGFIAAALAAVLAVRVFWGLPTKAQIAAVKQWLLGAVTEAEKALGGGTGKLKLRQVYDLFVQRFPWIARVVSFETFSGWVDDSLDDMREMLETNEAASAYVAGDAK